jgi:DNA-binding NarL/FixJ family response regulator
MLLAAHTHAIRRHHKVIILDADPLVRAGVAAVVAEHPGCWVSALCADASEALQAVTQHRPELAVLELASCAGILQLALLKQLTQKRHSLRLLVHSVHDETVFAQRVLQAGAHGYVMKGASVQQLHLGMRTVLDGGYYVSEPVQQLLLQGYCHQI